MTRESCVYINDESADLESLELGILTLCFAVLGHLFVGFLRRRSERARILQKEGDDEHSEEWNVSDAEEEDLKEENSKKSLKTKKCAPLLPSPLELLVGLPEDTRAGVCGFLPLRDLAALARIDKTTLQETWENSTLWQARLLQQDAGVPALSSSTGPAMQQEERPPSEGFRRRWFRIEGFQQEAFDVPDSSDSSSVAEALKEVCRVCTGLRPQDGEETMRAVAGAAVNLLRTYDCTLPEDRTAARNLMDRAVQVFGAEQVAILDAAFNDSMELFNMLEEVQERTDAALESLLDAVLDGVDMNPTTTDQEYLTSEEQEHPCKDELPMAADAMAMDAIISTLRTAVA